MKVRYNKESKQIVDNAVFPIVIEETYGQGLTKREYFTAMALQGISDFALEIGTPDSEIARKAVSLADAIISELNKSV